MTDHEGIVIIMTMGNAPRAVAMELQKEYVKRYVAMSRMCFSFMLTDKDMCMCKHCKKPLWQAGKKDTKQMRHMDGIATTSDLRCLYMMTKRVFIENHHAPSSERFITNESYGGRGWHTRIEIACGDRIFIVTEI